MHTTEYGAAVQCKCNTFMIYSMATGARIPQQSQAGWQRNCSLIL